MLRSPHIERLAILILVLMYLLTMKECRNQRNTITEQKDSVTYRKLKDGSITAESRAKDVTIVEFTQQLRHNRDSLKQLRERIGQINRLNRSLRFSLTIKGKGKAQMVDSSFTLRSESRSRTDTAIIAKSIRYNDRWLYINGIALEDSFHFNYCMQAELDIVTYWKRDGLFKPAYAVVNVRSDNPDLKITGIRDYEIRRKRHFYETKGFFFGLGALAAGLLILH